MADGAGLPSGKVKDIAKASYSYQRNLFSLAFRFLFIFMNLWVRSTLTALFGGQLLFVDSEIFSHLLTGRLCSLYTE